MELIITNKKGEKLKVLYDECDHELVAAHRWHVNSTGYAVSNIRMEQGRGTLLMHRLILDIKCRDTQVDHKNRNRLDNRRCNIRPCTVSENRRNKSSTGACKYLGVSYQKVNGRIYIRASITINSKNVHLGRFKTEEAAARAYDQAAKKHFGEFANLNFKD